MFHDLGCGAGETIIEEDEEDLVSIPNEAELKPATDKANMDEETNENLEISSEQNMGTQGDELKEQCSVIEEIVDSTQNEKEEKEQIDADTEIEDQHNVEENPLESLNQPKVEEVIEENVDVEQSVTEEIPNIETVENNLEVEELGSDIKPEADVETLAKDVQGDQGITAEDSSSLENPGSGLQPEASEADLTTDDGQDENNPDTILEKNNYMHKLSENIPQESGTDSERGVTKTKVLEESVELSNLQDSSDKVRDSLKLT